MPPNEREMALKQCAINEILLNEGLEKELQNHSYVQRKTLIKKHQIAIDSLFNKVIWKKSLSDSVLRDTYHKLEKIVGMRHILISHQWAHKTKTRRTKTEALSIANNIVSKIESGELDFEKAARFYSDDPLMKVEGGDLGFVYWGNMLPEVLYQAWNAPPRKTIGPFESGFGYHLIRVYGTKSAPQPAFDEAKKSIIHLIRSGKTPEFEVQKNKTEQALVKKYNFTFSEEAIDSLFQISQNIKMELKKNISISYLKNISFDPPIGFENGTPKLLSWFLNEAKLVKELSGTPVYSRFTLLKTFQDIAYRYLGVKEAINRGYVSGEILDQELRQIEQTEVINLILSQKLKSEKGLTFDILSNRILTSNEVWLNPKYITP
jgi:peptidyl-prolyl cis-trans isomerase C